MNIDVTFRHTHEESHAATQTYITEQVEKHLTPKLEHFHASQLRLHIVVERLKQEYNMTLRLHLPHKKVLISHATDKHLPPAMDAAISKLARQVEKYRD